MAEADTGVIEENGAGGEGDEAAAAAAAAAEAAGGAGNDDDKGGGDWRTDFATDGEKVDDGLLKSLGRYHSPAAFANAWKKQNDEIASGQWIRPLGEDPSEDDVAAFRKQTGVPEDFAGYKETLTEGLVIGVDDAPFADKFFEDMHAAGSRPSDVNAALGTYFAMVAEQKADQADLEAQAATAGEDELRKEWGDDYRRNLGAAHSYLDTLPPSVKAIFQGGTMPVEISKLDAKGEPMFAMQPIGYNSEAMRWLTSMALADNPLATVVPGAGSNQAAAIADELAAIQKVQTETPDAYWKDEAMQTRRGELLAARDQIADKGA